MTHTQTNLMVPGGDTAVLFIHGIVGSPAHFRLAVDLEGLVPENWSKVNLCLPGHGGTVSDFSRSSMKQWKAHVWKAFEELSSTHSHIIIVGHSMGTLFALQLAEEFPDKVQQLMLLQCPLSIGLRWFGIVNMLQMPFGLVRDDDVYGAAMKTAAGVKLERNIFKYIPWIFRVLELFLDIIHTRRRIGKVHVPAIAFQARKDELVANWAARFLRKKSTVTVVEMEESTHMYYPPEDKKRMQEAFLEFCKSEQ